MIACVFFCCAPYWIALIATWASTLAVGVVVVVVVDMADKEDKTASRSYPT